MPGEPTLQFLDNQGDPSSFTVKGFAASPAVIVNDSGRVATVNLRAHVFI
jgi:hypothetical protein